MATVRVILTSFQQSWDLPRERLLQLLPESLLAQALEDDPTATEITLTNPSVTPEAMQVITDYLDGLEPMRVIPNLETSADYLNIPWLTIYSDPLYAELHHPIVNTEENIDVLTMAIKEGDIQMVMYLLSKGISSVDLAISQAIRSHQLELFKLLWADPRNKIPDTHASLIKAVRADALNIVKYLLPTLELSPEDLQEIWSEAWQAEADSVMTYLLQTYHKDIDIESNWDEAIDSNSVYLIRLLYPYMPFEDVYTTAENAITNHENTSAEIILEQPEFTEFLGELLAFAAENENPSIVEYLAGRIDPSVNDNAALRKAVMINDIEITKFLLSDPRVHPETIQDADFEDFILENPDLHTVELLREHRGI